MKYVNSVLILSVFLGFSSINGCYSLESRNTLGGRINLAGPNSVAEKANQNASSLSSPYSDMLQNPLVNSTLNSFGTMMQGATGGSYNAGEQAKQQLDYAKQQSNYKEN